MIFRVPVWWRESHYDEVTVDARTDEQAREQARALVDESLRENYEFTRTLIAIQNRDYEIRGRDSGRLLVPTWLELHADQLRVEARDKQAARERAEDKLFVLGDHGYDFTDTYSEQRTYGVDDVIPVRPHRGGV